MFIYIIKFGKEKYIIFFYNFLRKTYNFLCKTFITFDVSFRLFPSRLAKI